MNPGNCYHLTQDRVAGLHRQAQRGARARAARRARPPRAPQPGHPLPALAALITRRVRTMLAARSS